MEIWKAVFKTWIDDAPAINNFLRDRLKLPNKHHLGQAGSIIIESPTRDDCFRTAEWLRHQNPTGKLLNYTVAGYDEGKIIYVSYCKLCREGERHDEHQKT